MKTSYNSFDPLDPEYRTIDVKDLLINGLLNPGETSYNSFDPLDPYGLLVKKKQRIDSGESLPVDDINVEALYELETFCKTHGIIGFNSKNMNPTMALKMLKSKMGIKETPINKTSLLLG